MSYVANPLGLGFIALHNQQVAEGHDPQTTAKLLQDSLAAHKRGDVPDGELRFIFNGTVIMGWTQVSVSRGVERFPGSFEVHGTPKLPNENPRVLPINSPCVVAIGAHPVLTGYVERIKQSLSDGKHTMTWSGRGRCCDLADCAGLINNQTRQLTTLTALAKALVKPFANGKIDVVTPDGDGYGQPFPTVTINLDETPYDIIERMARYEGLLVYENETGDLVLSRVGDVKHSSGFVEGKNVVSADYTVTRDQRFSDYIPLTMSTDTLTRNGAALGQGGASAGKVVNDKEIERYRPKLVVSEQNVGSTFLAQLRAQWEALRRSGQSFKVTITCDSWLDDAGVPWTPNQLVPLTIPTLGLTDEDFIIVNAEYRRDGGTGTTATVHLMLPAALTVEPTALDSLAARQVVPAPNPATGSPTPRTPPATAPNSGAASPNFNPRANEPTGGL